MKPCSDELLSNVAFNFNQRPYAVMVMVTVSGLTNTVVGLCMLTPGFRS